MTADLPPSFDEATSQGLPSYDSASSQPHDVKLSVISAEKGGDVLISITPPLQPLAEKKVERAPADICCVIDVSGSMDTAATMPDESGKQTETQLSILDVVRHAMRTIMATLGPQDRMAVVAFTNAASVYANLTFMDDKGKQLMEKTIQDLAPLGSTNLWDGLKTGMDLLHGLVTQDRFTASARKEKPGTVSRMIGRFSSGKGKAAEPNEKPSPPTATAADVDPHRVASIFLLTDGLPNVHPPKGELGAFKAYLDVHPATFTVNTFGFGYSLDSHLLLQLAAAGGGQYCFIPDSGMVGTVFVHAVANALSTYAPTSTLDIEVPEGAEVSVLGGLQHTKTSWGVKVDLGDLMYGQTRDIVVRTVDPQLSATARFTAWTDTTAVTLHASTMPATDAAARAAVKYHAHRLELVSILLQASSSVPSAPYIEALRQIAQAVRGDADLANHKNALALVQDIEGQVVLALENETYFNRWGRHYLRSLARAHQRQHCVNFKDEGQLVYGAESPLFCAARDALDKAFNELPAPKPTRKTYGGASSGRAVYSMSSMNSRCGPCVAGSCTVTLASGRTVRVDQLTRGDRIVTAAGLRAVVAIVRTEMDGGRALLCALPGGLLVTPWHPVRLGRTGDWVFPADAADAQLLPCDAVYSLLLERQDGNAGAHAVTTNGVDVIALGHGVSSGILAHAFFADYDRVARALVDLPGINDDSGVVHCAGVRRGADGRVDGFLVQGGRVAGVGEEVHMPVALRV